MKKKIPCRKTAVAGLIFGIVSCFLGWIVPLPIIGQIISLIIGITGLILTIISRKKITEAGYKSKIITAALILSITGIISSVLSVFIYGFLTLGTAYTVNSIESTQADPDAFKSQLESVLENVK